MVDEANKIYDSYPVFKFNQVVRLFKNRPEKQSLVVTLVFVLLIILASSIDHTFLLAGTDIGLFEHPTIWTFLILQAIIPYIFKKAVDNLFEFLEGADIVKEGKDLSKYKTVFTNNVHRKTNAGKVIYSFLITVGLGCFVWNSFQNQDPYRIVGFDFWDSINHVFGYWITRVYKFYLWVLFFPSIVHMHISLLLTLNKLLKDAIKENFFSLKPFHQDEYGGVGKIIKTAIDPWIPVLLIASLSVLSALLIHKQLSVTPIVGICLLSALFVVIYLIPAITLRKIIQSEKKRQLNEVTQTQNAFFYKLSDTNESGSLSKNLEAINGLAPIYKQVKSISSWPYYTSVLKIIGLINIPTIIGISKAVWPLVKQ